MLVNCGSASRNMGDSLRWLGTQLTARHIAVAVAEGPDLVALDALRMTTAEPSRTAAELASTGSGSARATAGALRTLTAFEVLFNLIGLVTNGAYRLA